VQGLHTIPIGDIGELLGGGVVLMVSFLCTGYDSRRSNA